MPKNIYKLKDGTVVPGVTTIINQLDKPQLLGWVAKLTTEGKDWKAERDSAGDIGTLVHEAIMDFLRGGQIEEGLPDMADNCVAKFEDWYMKETGGYEPEAIVEQPLVSEKLKFGGQPDIFIPEWNRLLDIKTSNGIYDSFWLQLAGYAILLEENGYKVSEYQILWLPKDNRFDCPIKTDLRKEKKIFKHLLGIYQLRRE